MSGIKPLSGLVKEWQWQANTVGHPINEEQSQDFHFERGRQYCADLLQAWLREAEAWTWHEADRDGTICVSDILSGLLGPTQKPKQEGEK